MSRYQIGDLIGQGGMARVHEASRRLADDGQQPVVIKRMRPEHEPFPRAHERFRREAAIGLALAHPNLVKVFDFDRHGQEPCIVMERIDGLSLHELLRCVKLPYEVVRRIVMNVAEALEYVHDRGILHRDISPGNILISRQGEVKLADFGMARLLAEPRTTPGFKGTAAYASPEAIQCHELEPSADFYSLAAVVYELLMGMPPYGWGGPEEIGHRQDPASGWVIEPLPADVPDDLRALVTDLLAPAERRQLRTAEHVLTLLALGPEAMAPNELLAGLVACCADEAATRTKARPGERARASGRLPRTIFTSLIILGLLSASWHGREAAPVPDRGERAPIAARAATALPADVVAALPQGAEAVREAPREARAVLPAHAAERLAEEQPVRRSEGALRIVRPRAGRARAVGSRATRSGAPAGRGRGVGARHGFQP